MDSTLPKSLMKTNQKDKKMETTILLFAVAGTILFNVGCSKSMSGIVGWHEKNFFFIYDSPDISAEPTAGWFAPDIPFTAEDGKQTTLHTERQDETLLFFTMMSPEKSYLGKAKFAAFADEFSGFPVTVVQISVPIDGNVIEATENVIHEPGKGHMISLYDINGMAWKAYGRPKLNALFLVDGASRITAVERFDNIDELIKRARYLGTKAIDAWSY